MKFKTNYLRSDSYDSQFESKLDSVATSLIDDPNYQITKNVLQQNANDIALTAGSIGDKLISIFGSSYEATQVFLDHIKDSYSNNEDAYVLTMDDFTINTRDMNLGMCGDFVDTLRTEYINRGNINRRFRSVPQGSWAEFDELCLNNPQLTGPALYNAVMNTAFGYNSILSLTGCSTEADFAQYLGNNILPKLSSTFVQGQYPSDRMTVSDVLVDLDTAKVNTTMLENLCRVTTPYSLPRFIPVDYVSIAVNSLSLILGCIQTFVDIFSGDKSLIDNVTAAAEFLKDAYEKVQIIGNRITDKLSNLITSMKEIITQYFGKLDPNQAFSMLISTIYKDSSMKDDIEEELTRDGVRNIALRDASYLDSFNPYDDNPERYAQYNLWKVASNNIRNKLSNINWSDLTSNVWQASYSLMFVYPAKLLWSGLQIIGQAIVWTLKTATYGLAKAVVGIMQTIDQNITPRPVTDEGVKKTPTLTAGFIETANHVLTWDQSLAEPWVVSEMNSHPDTYYQVNMGHYVAILRKPSGASAWAYSDCFIKYKLYDPYKLYDFFTLDRYNQRSTTHNNFFGNIHYATQYQTGGVWCIEDQESAQRLLDQLYDELYAIDSITLDYSDVNTYEGWAKLCLSIPMSKLLFAEIETLTAVASGTLSVADYVTYWSNLETWDNQGAYDIYKITFALCNGVSSSLNTISLWTQHLKELYERDYDGLASWIFTIEEFMEFYTYCGLQALMFYNINGYIFPIISNFIQCYITDPRDNLYCNVYTCDDRFYVHTVTTSDYILPKVKMLIGSIIGVVGVIAKVKYNTFKRRYIRSSSMNIDMLAFNEDPLPYSQVRKVRKAQRTQKLLYKLWGLDANEPDIIGEVNSFVNNQVSKRIVNI